MKIRNLLIETAIFLLAYANQAAALEAHLVETKIQTDVENTLSRMFPKEQFLVLVTTELTMRTERKMVEGEVFVTPPETPDISVISMPGFLPEPDLRPPQKPQPNRQTYRIVETPELLLARVNVQLDEQLPQDRVMRAKTSIQGYLRNSYPNKSIVTFEQIPMLKVPKPEIPPLTKQDTVDKDAQKDKEKGPETWMSSPMKWVALGLLLFAMYLLFERRKDRAANAGYATERRGLAAGEDGESVTARLLKGVLGAVQNANGSRDTAGNSFASNAQPLPAGPSPEVLRRKLLERFLSRSDAFRIYFQRLSETSRVELCSALKGPALDGLFEGLSLIRPKGEEVQIDLQQCVEKHEKDFSEFVQAKEWQDRQFFGFLQQLTDEQLITLANHQNPLAVCIMLRFMKANQSAFVLEALPNGKRVEVLSQISMLNNASFSDLASIEQEVRTSVQRMPNHLYGSKKEDINFWGSVLSEAHDQDAILDDLEKTQPEIYPNLKKFKFRLEDAAALPDNLLGKILADTDNEELGLALATVSSQTCDVLLDAVSPKRRQFVINQLESFRKAPADRTNAARLALTKKFREVLSA